MPLFVAGDLSGDQDREMVNHLAICEECGRLAQEFRESNSLLTEAYALPEFGAQFYDEAWLAKRLHAAAGRVTR